MIDHLKASDCLFMDEATVPVLAPGTGQTRLDYLWAIARDQRGHGGPDPPIVEFHHSRNRSAKVALELMRDYAGGEPLLLVAGRPLQARLKLLAVRVAGAERVARPLRVHAF